MNEPSAFELLRNLAAVVGAVVTISSFLLWMTQAGRRLFVATLGRKRRWYRALEQLTPDVDIGRFDSYLGSPAFVNNRGSFVEFIYVHDYFYVQAVASHSGRVLFYTVTTRRLTFSPRIWGRELSVGGDQSSKGFRIGRFSFRDCPMAETPVGIRSWKGARRFEYTEAYYFGNPGFYQTYVLAVNDSGAFDNETVEVVGLALPPDYATGLFADGGGVPEPPPEETSQFRNEARPNTYGVSSRDWAKLRRLARIGADKDQVRILG